MRSPSLRQCRSRAALRRCPAVRADTALVALLLSLAGVTVAQAASAAPVPAGTAAPGAPGAWTDVPLETLGDDHRVREGLVADPSGTAADAELAARGIVVDGTPALDRLLRRAAREKASGDARDDGGYPFGGYAEVWVADVGVLLRDDRDGDGFFGSFELSLDVDTDGYSREVYAVLELTDAYGVPSLRHDTVSFTIRGSATSDEYRVEVELLRNHPAGYRDLRVDIRDARDGRLLDEISAYGFSSLAALPLESEDGDFVDDGYGGYGTGDAYVAGYAAAGGPLATLALAAFALLRRRHRRPAGSA